MTFIRLPMALCLYLVHFPVMFMKLRDLHYEGITLIQMTNATET